MLELTIKRLRKRSVRARGTIVVSALVFAVFAVFGLLQPVWLAPVGFVAIVAASVLARRRRKLPNRLLKKRGRARGDPIVLAAAVVSALPDPAVLMDEDGGILLQNAHAEAVFGGRARGTHITSVLRAPRILDAVDRVRQTGETVRLDHATQVPIERHFEVLVAPVAGLAGSSILLLMRDLTRQERAERMRAEFVANASHELRTPLASLLGFVETLQGPARSDPAAQARFLGIMRTEAMRMSRLIDDLLSLSRIELNAHVLPNGRVDLARAVAHVADTLSPIARDNGVEIEVTAEPGRYEVKGDRDELVQVFQNIVENAVKYGRDGRKVEIGIGPHGAGEVRVSVRDHGPGIAAEHLPRLTERFYRAEKSHSRELGGTGLGLAIVKHILNRHRGRMTIDSTLGKGAEFTVVLPLSSASASLAAAE